MSVRVCMWLGQGGSGEGIGWVDGVGKVGCGVWRKRNVVKDG